MINTENFNYSKKHIALFADTALFSTLSINLIAPMFSVYVMFPFMEKLTLFIWSFIHVLILVFRIYLYKKLQLSLKNDSDNVMKETNTLFTLSILGTFLYAYLIWFAVLNEIPEANIFILSAVMLTLSAGSISTLVSIFPFFAFFVFVNTLSIISAVMYHGGNMFYVYAVLLTSFMVIFIKVGYSQYLLLNNLVALKDSFQNIYDKSTDGICLMQGNRFKDCNQSILQLFQYETREEFLTTHVSKMMPTYQEDGTNSIKKMLKMANKARKNGHHSFEWIYAKVDGTRFWAEVVLTKINIDGEELLHGTYRDISKRKEFEKQQEEFQSTLIFRVNEEVEKNRQKDKTMLHQSKLAQMGEMISMIAHQWRQPLSAISATSGSMSLKAQLGTLEKETLIELSQKITDYAQHLSVTIDDFRNFFREDKVKNKTSLEAIVSGTLTIVKPTLENAEIKLLVQKVSDTEINTFVSEVQQVVLNIIKNAEDALIEKKIQNPEIIIKIEGTTITISDNAGGIPEDLLEVIFEPYFSTKTKKDGTGLGLYMSKTIIQEHCDGNLSVSNNENGAVFKIDFPQ